MWLFYYCPVFQSSKAMARHGIICSILIVYFMVVMPTTGQYCPKDYNPIIEDHTNCTFQIHNDTTAVQNLLEMVANWGDGSIQDINIPIIISGNDTRSSSQHGGKSWILMNFVQQSKGHNFKICAP
jgi:hypothetical protein